MKCTLAQALRFCLGRTARRGSRDIALLFLDHGTRRGWVVSSTPRPLFNPGKDPVTIVQEAGWAPGPVWIGAENLVPTGNRSPDRQGRSQSLYRLRYPAHHCKRGSYKIRNRALKQQTTNLIGTTRKEYCGKIIRKIYWQLSYIAVVYVGQLKCFEVIHFRRH